MFSSTIEHLSCRPQQVYVAFYLAQLPSTVLITGLQHVNRAIRRHHSTLRWLMRAAAGHHGIPRNVGACFAVTTMSVVIQMAVLQDR